MDALTRNFTFEESQPQRLDLFLVNKVPELSRSQIQRLIKEGQILVNQIQPGKSGLMLAMKDEIRVHIPPPEPIDLIPEPIDLSVVYEDENILVIDKPAGMVVHPSAGHHKGTLVHAALSHTPFLEGIGGKMRPGIVHRLDKDTSGLILIAKNEPAHKWLQNQFKDRKVEKTYLALVDNHPATPSGRIIAPIYRDRKDRKKMAIAPVGEGRPAITEYETIRNYKNHAYLSVHPLTGRTHQIRVHLASINCPVAGDTIYGFKHPSALLNRHFLHACRIRICLLGEKTPHVFEAELPVELSSVLDRLY